MRRLWAIALVGAILILVAVMILSDKAPDKPKEGELRSINTPSHGVGVLFGSPKYEAKGEPVDGGFLDKKGAGEPMAPLPSAPSDGRAIEE
ncbi:Uncharacterised protein [Klebsiella pneumoniae]|nr:Uncharacterised protein [Klebsiella pneumoniae]